MPAKRHRITRADEYQYVVRKGHRVGGAFCITYAVLHVPEQAKNTQLSDTMTPVSVPQSTNEAMSPPARFGFIISKRVGNAVTRNLIRRRMKTIVERRLHQGFHSADVVFRMFESSAKASFEQLSREVNRALDRVEQLPKGRR